MAKDLMEAGYRLAMDIVSDRAMATTDAEQRNVVWNVYHVLVRELSGKLTDAASKARKQEI